MPSPPHQGSLHALLASLWQVFSGLVELGRRQTAWAAWRQFALLLTSTGRAVMLVAMPLLAMAAGNLLLFSGQGQEFLGEFVRSSAEVSAQDTPLQPKTWWLLGVSLWSLAAWYCARRLLARLYPPGDGAACVRLWEDLLRAQLPRVLGLACVVPLALAMAALLATPAARQTLLSPPLSLLLGGALLIETALDGHREPVPFRVGALLVGLVLLIYGAGRLSDGLANPGLWAGVGLQVVTVALLALGLGLPWARGRRARRILWFVAAAGCLLAAAGAWQMRLPGHQVQALPVAAITMALDLFIVIVWRREMVNAWRSRGQRPASLLPAAAHQEAAIATSQWRVMALSIVSSFVLTGLLAAWPIEIGRALGAPSIALLALASMTLFFSLVLVLLPRTLGWPSMVVPALLSALVVGYLDPYRPTPGQHLRPGDDPRPTLAEHLAQWKRQQRAADDDPIIIAAAEGGGIRAAVWTAFALARLNDATCGQFQRRLYAISSVSGGSLGAAFFVAQGAEAGATDSSLRPGCWLQGSRLSQEALHFFFNDFISPVLGAYLFGDLLRQFPGANLVPGGRGAVLESTWQHDWQQALGGPRQGPNRFAQPFLDLYSGAGRYGRPLLFLNATTVEDGKRAIAAPVRSPFVDAFDLFHERLATDGMTLASAVHNSARFPFVSPPGFIEQRAGDGAPALKPWGRVVDGGYFENAGATTALEIVEQIARAQGGRRDNIHVLILSNEPRAPDERLCQLALKAAPAASGSLPATEGYAAAAMAGAAAASQAATGTLCRTDTVKGDAPRNAWLPDIDAPLHTLLATRQARGSFATTALAAAIGDAERVHELYLAKWSRAYIDPPLGWYLSPTAIAGIDEALSPSAKTFKEVQPARLALQRLAWQLVMPGPYDPADDAPTLASKRSLALCQRSGAAGCADARP